jgi:hypothetical protein
MPARLAGDHLKPSTLKLTAANGTTIPILGTRRMHFSVAGFRLSALFCVTDAVDEIILSRPWLAENQIQWNFGDSVVIRGRHVELKSRASQVDVRRVIAAENVHVQPRTCTAIPVNLTRTSLRGRPANVVFEPKCVAGRGITARALFTDEVQGSALTPPSGSETPVLTADENGTAVTHAVGAGSHSPGEVEECSAQKVTVRNSDKGTPSVGERLFALAGYGARELTSADGATSNRITSAAAGQPHGTGIAGHARVLEARPDNLADLQLDAAADRTPPSDNETAGCTGRGPRETATTASASAETEQRAAEADGTAEPARPEDGGEHVGFRRVTTRAQAKAASMGDYAGSDGTPPAADVATSNSMGAARRNGRKKQAV